MASRRWRNSYPATPIGKARAKIDGLVKMMQSPDFQSKVGIEVTEVFKGGSLGQGTAVVHHFDIDLVLYSRSLKVKDVVRDGYETYFDTIDSCLKKELGECYFPEDKYTNVAIKFEIKQPGESRIGVDLILSPYFRDIHEMLGSLREVKKSDRLKMFSVSASKWQTQFIKQQDIWVREFIRRAKAWKNIKWKDSNEGRPKSYLISILVIVAYARLPPEMKIRRKKGLRKIVPRMTAEFKALIKEIERNPQLDLSVPGSDRSLQDLYCDLLAPCPRIIDPVNPANNLYLSGIQRCMKEDNKWAPFMRKISSLDLSPAIIKQHEKLFRPVL